MYPRVIPLGTVLWVPGYGIARAEDVGGAVMGKHIDLFFLDRKTALAWGRWTETVTILRGGGWTANVDTAGRAGRSDWTGPT